MVEDVSLDELEIVVAFVAAIHRAQQAVRTRLHGQMQERHQLFDIAVG